MSYSTEQVCQRLGVTPRMLQWWDEQEVIEPHHVGHARAYTQDDLIDAYVCISLRKKGMPLRLVRMTLRNIGKLFGVQRYLIVNGFGEVETTADAKVALSQISEAGRLPIYVIDMTGFERGSERKKSMERTAAAMRQGAYA